MFDKMFIKFGFGKDGFTRTGSYMFLKFFEYSVQKTIAIMEKIGNKNDWIGSSNPKWGNVKNIVIQSKCLILYFYL